MVSSALGPPMFLPCFSYLYLLPLWPLCAHMYMTQDSCVSGISGQPFLARERPWWPAIGQWGEVTSWQLELGSAEGVCWCVSVTRCPQLPTLGLFWSLWSREKALLALWLWVSMVI